MWPTPPSAAPARKCWSAASALGQGAFALNVTTPTATSERMSPRNCCGKSPDQHQTARPRPPMPTRLYLWRAAHRSTQHHGASVGGDRRQRLQQHRQRAQRSLCHQHRRRTLIRKIDTLSGTAGTSPGGLSSPAAIDTNADGYVDLVYAGDIDGKLWKFDLSNSDSTAWSYSLLYNTANTRQRPLPWHRRWQRMLRAAIW